MNGGILLRESLHDISHAVKDTVRESDPRFRDVMIHLEPANPRG